jgi:AmpE protein
MRFLALVLVYILQRRYNLGLSRDLDRFCSDVQQRLVSRSTIFARDGWLLFLIVVGVPTLVLALLIWLAKGWLFGMPELFLQVIVLFVILGCPRLKSELQSYLHAWRAGDVQAAFLHAQNIGYSLDEPIDNPAQLHQRVWSEYLHQTFARYFSIIFWFMVLGAVGALFARLTNQAALNGQSPALQRFAARLDHLLQWVPARLLALTFALAGNFVASMRRSLNDLIDPFSQTWPLLTRAAEGALVGEITADPAAPVASLDAQREHEMKEMLRLRDLLNRSLIVWFAGLAVLVLAGYL